MNDDIDNQPYYPSNEVTPEEAAKEHSFLESGMDSAELLKELLNNEHIPKDTRIGMWALFGNTVKLTFLTEADVQRYLLKFKWYRYTILESLPKSQYNSELEATLALVEIEFESNLRRSLGGKLNFLETITANIRASFENRPLSGSNAGNVGFLSRIANSINAIR